MHIEHNSQTAFYRTPFGAVTTGSEIQLRLSVRNGGMPHSVRVVITPDGKDATRVDMAYVFSVQDASIYEAKINVGETPALLWYHFEVVTDNGTAYYGNNPELLGGVGAVYQDTPAKKFQITVYSEDYSTPDWFKNAIVYQIFPDRFYNGNPSGEFLGNRTDIIKRSWGDTPFHKAEQFGGEYKANDFFGGNLLGIIKKLPYLEDLGVTVIYLNPIFKASSNHKYDTGSYEEIDEMFGDEETFKALCREAGKRGIRIILDGVFNHTGDDSMYFNRYGRYDTVGAYQSEASEYYPWYRFSSYPDEYESWWGMKTLPQLAEENLQLREYLITGENSIVKKWIRLGASGWRLDVVDELPDFFVKELREAVKSVEPDAVIVGEVWEDASNKVAYDERREYFLGGELDSVMNYPLRTTLIDGALGYIDAMEFDRRIMSLMENYPKCSHEALLNIISSHDTERIVTLMSGAPTRHEVDRDFQACFRLTDSQRELAIKRTKLVWGMVLTMPGAPSIFYGDELGIEGYGDPFTRMCFPWDRVDDDGYQAMRSFMKRFIALRKSDEAFTTGNFESVYKLGKAYGYMREAKYLVVANFDGNDTDIRIDIARYGARTLRYKEGIYGGCDYTSVDGIFFVKAPGYGVTVYECE